MPLPENWDGIFYGKETCGDMLFDLTPEEFADAMEEHKTELSGPPPFFVGGAYVDLKVNGYHDRAKDLLEAGRKKWPTAPWSNLEQVIAILGERFGSPAGCDKTFIDNIVATMFGTWTTLPSH